MNRLAHETSPYLRQHAENPVDWYPWGPEALAEARRRDVPLLVSIGYSACHWCHVMAHESFEDEQTARLLNERFVAVKVDREERPDVDAVYLEAVQALNDGRAGWPLTAFATPDGRPFFGGTYFPPEPRHGMPAFRAVLEAVAEAWASRRHEVLDQADGLTEAVAARLGPPPAGEDGDGGGAAEPEKASAGRAAGGHRTAVDAGSLLDEALARIRALYDGEHGGIGTAPKFPQAPVIELLLRAHVAGRPGALEMAAWTLEHMAAGGIYDHLGGGFARYSTDAAWQIPHFEKMLYDQALLARTYLHAWQLTGREGFRRVLDETLGYLLRDLSDPSGGLCSSEDADSEGAEGRFYTWTPAELEEVLGPGDAALLGRYYGVTREGNFEGGRSVLHREPGGEEPGEELEAARRRLLEARSRRVRPGLDDKVLTEWNAMAAATLAEAAAATGTPAWAQAAAEVAEHLFARLRRADGRWMRSWRSGRIAHLAVAGDYAWLVECATRLAECTGGARWIERAAEAASGLVELFSAPDGGWYTTGADAEALVVRPRELFDGALPSGGSVAALALARLGALSGDRACTERAEATLAAAARALRAAPLAFPHLLQAALLLEDGPVEVVAGRAVEPTVVASIQSRYLPEVVLAWGEPTASPLWSGRDLAGDASVYVCRRGACRLPVQGGEAVLAELHSALGRAA